MSDALALPLQGWQDFYILAGTAAATLVGLMFVAISLGSRLITQQSMAALRVFLTPTIIHFIYVLVLATVMLIPAVRRMPLGILLVIAGLLSFGRSVSTVPYMLRQHRQQIIDAHDWTWYLIVPSLIYLMFVGTGIGLLLGANQALNGLAFVSILLLVNGVRNAWDMVVWFAVKTDPPAH